jgi:hypothetical protein
MWSPEPTQKNGAKPKSQMSRKKIMKGNIMNLKTATLIAIIGVILLLIPAIMYFLANLEMLSWVNQSGQRNWYFQYVGILNIIGSALLLPFFITLFKSQK